MSHYASGTRFEHKTKSDLTDNGYAVMRAAGSKGSTKADLAAFKPGQLLLVQCKRTGNISTAEWNRLVEVAAWVGAVPVVAENGPRGRGVAYWRLLATKCVGMQRPWPWEPFLLDELAVTP